MGDLATMAQMKELDRIAIEERGIPSLELMENGKARPPAFQADVQQDRTHALMILTQEGEGPPGI